VIFPSQGLDVQTRGLQNLTVTPPSPVRAPPASPLGSPLPLDADTAERVDCNNAHPIVEGQDENNETGEVSADASGVPFVAGEERHSLPLEPDDDEQSINRQPVADAAAGASRSGVRDADANAGTSAAAGDREGVNAVGSSSSAGAAAASCSRDDAAARTEAQIEAEMEAEMARELEADMEVEMEAQMAAEMVAGARARARAAKAAETADPVSNQRSSHSHAAGTRASAASCDSRSLLSLSVSASRDGEDEETDEARRRRPASDFTIDSNEDSCRGGDSPLHI